MMIREQWNDLIVHNPMLIEITRFRRRFLSASAGGSVNGIVMVLALICYATLVLIVIENRESISPIYLIIFETGFLTLLAPMLLYNAIAGERERRSWDLLLAAPITKAQIVVGKFMGAMSGLLAVTVLFQVPIEIAGVSYERAHWQTLLSADFMSFSFLMTVCALTILFSARVKRGLMALGATLGSLVSLLVVFPALVDSGGADNHSFYDVAFFLHPLIALTRISDYDNYLFEKFQATKSVLVSGSAPLAETEFRSNVPAAWWGWPQTLCYIGLAIILLAWASNTLIFAENEVKFLPQGHKDA
jgi:ABC-type transport system involved in multi-copper enzyme maturation permease subunit